MKMSNLTIATIISTFIAAASIATPAKANCMKSVWTKTAGDSFAETILGRQCGNVMSVKFKGPVGDTGWVAMHRKGPNSLVANFVDNNVSTEINMQTNGTTMQASFYHVENSGTTAYTFGGYSLTSFQ